MLTSLKEHTYLTETYRYILGATMLRRSVTSYHQRPGLSVIIAGATGNTGSELVTRLVSHKAVTRIVALTRKDISVDRWKQHFPNLRTTDALKYLSIVAVDWDRIFQDAGSIPASVLCSRPLHVESREEELMEIARQASEDIKSKRGRDGAQAREAAPNGTETTNEAVDLWSNETFKLESVGAGGPSPSAVPSHRSKRSRSHHQAAIAQESMPLRSPPSLRPEGSSNADVGGQIHRRVRQKLKEREAEDKAKNDAASAKARLATNLSIPSSTLVGSDHLITLQERTAIQTICQDPYYRSVFSGHTVAINCLGSHRLFWGNAVATVDLDYSLAFAKLVRLFNCVSITDAFLQDVTVGSKRDSLRDYGARRSLITEGSTEWGEIRSACFGRMVNVSWNAKDKDSVGTAKGKQALESDEEKAYHQSTKDPSPPAKPNVWEYEGFDIAPFLPNSSPGTAPKPDATKSAARIAAGQKAMKHKHDYEERKADEAQLRHWDQAIEKALRGRRHTAHTLQHFVQVSASGASENSRMTYFKVHGQCDQRMLSLYDYALPRKPRGFLTTMLFGKDKAEPIPIVAASVSETVPVPVTAKETLLAPTLDHQADVTIFRPGLLARRNPTLVEKCLAFVTPPLEVSALADVIVDDIMSKQAQVDAGLEALAVLQQRLNEKYKYKLYVTRELGTPEWHVGLGPDTSFASYVSSAAFNSNSAMGEVDTGSEHPHTSLVSPPVSSLSRAKLFEAVAREKAEIKSRLGVAASDVDGDHAEEEVDAFMPSSKKVGAAGTSAIASICSVCDLRERVGSVPTATILGERDIKQRYTRMTSHGGSNTVKKWVSGPQQEQLCHQS